MGQLLLSQYYYFEINLKTINNFKRIIINYLYTVLLEL